MQNSKKRTARYIHKIVAETFLPKTSENQVYVIHLDYDKHNNKAWNLAWTTKKEKEVHQFSNPEYQEHHKKITNSKLNAAKVKMIKKKLFNPKRKTRMKMIAKQFGISEMQLYRIKVGENWGYVTID